MFVPSPKPDIQAIKKDLRQLKEEQERNVNDYRVNRDQIEQTNTRLRSKIGDLLRTGTPIVAASGAVITSLDCSQGCSPESEARYLVGVAKAALKHT